MINDKGMLSTFLMPLICHPFPILWKLCVAAAIASIKTNTLPVPAFTQMPR